PGLSPFVSELMVIIAAFDYHWLVGSVAVLAIVLAAFYALWMYQRAMTGPGREGLAPVADLDTREAGILAPLLVALLVFGFFPMPLLDVINPYIVDSYSTAGLGQEGGHQ
ncbi:MAG: NADH-quinone oxidoreductase subunit M, partial [Nocardioides sp.]